MFVICFNVTMAAQFYKTTLKAISNEFGKNIPKSLPYEGGPLGFITHLFCVDARVNIEDICNDYVIVIVKFNGYVLDLNTMFF